MDKVIVTWARGLLCVLAMTGLAACKNDDAASGTGNPPVSEQPVDPAPIDPTPEQPEQPEQPSGESPNAAPQITGSPAGEITVGQGFNFVPNATDEDDDDLTFSVSSKPGWASFDRETGRLWGTPGPSDVGSHEEITIRVTDGSSTRSLPEFAINVVQQAGGSVTLAWQPPTENTDGSSLSNLKGYKLHYGSASGDYDTTIDIDNAGVTRYVIEDLGPGTYFFAITAVNQKGVESEMSGEASKTI